MTLPFPVNTPLVMSMDITVSTPLFNHTSCMKSMDIIVNTVEQPKLFCFFVFLKVGPPKEDIFWTTFYGLYFNHHYITFTNS